VAGLLGMARRAGALAAGDFAARKAVEQGRARLVLLATDAGRSVTRQFQRLSRAGGIDLIHWGDKELLGRLLGLSPRTVVVITDESFARGLRLAAGTIERG